MGVYMPHPTPPQGITGSFYSTPPPPTTHTPNATLEIEFLPVPFMLLF